MSFSGWYHIDVEEIVRETDWAFFMRTKKHKEIWMPKSQIKDANNYQEGDTDCTVSVTDYIAEKRGFIRG